MLTNRKVQLGLSVAVVSMSAYKLANDMAYPPAVKANYQEYCYGYATAGPVCASDWGCFNHPGWDYCVDDLFCAGMGFNNPANCNWGAYDYCMSNPLYYCT
jgi:hypothetical protein